MCYSIPRHFALIELLVVFAILAIVFALLLPALSRAQTTSREVACVNNLRQIGQVFHSYAADNRGRLPPYSLCNGCLPQPNGHSDAKAIKKTYVINTLSSYSPVERWGNEDRGTPDLSVHSWGCPEVSSSQVQRGIGYGVSTTVVKTPCAGGSVVLPRVRKKLYLYGDTYRLSGIQYVTEQFTYADQFAGWDAGNAQPAPRHNERSSIIFCDGHAESYAFFLFDYLNNNEVKNFLNP